MMPAPFSRDEDKGSMKWWKGVVVKGVVWCTKLSHRYF